MCEKLAASELLLGVEVVELNPVIDHENYTGNVAVWLIEHALGKTIV
jgi:arginase family enzyme